MSWAGYLAPADFSISKYKTRDDDSNCLCKPAWGLWRPNYLSLWTQNTFMWEAQSMSKSVSVFLQKRVKRKNAKKAEEITVLVPKVSHSTGGWRSHGSDVLVMICTYKTILKILTTNNCYKILQEHACCTSVKKCHIKTNKQDQIIALDMVFVSLGSWVVLHIWLESSAAGLVYCPPIRLHWNSGCWCNYTSANLDKAWSPLRPSNAH